jgi:ClpP class serine protease
MRDLMNACILFCDSIGSLKSGIIIPGSAKSAGTIFTMAGDEILMSPNSSLGPIDAQVMMNGKRFSADAFPDGFAKINPDYVHKVAKASIFFCALGQMIIRI